MFHKNRMLKRRTLVLVFIEIHNPVTSILEITQKIHKPEAFLDFEKLHKHTSNQSVFEMHPFE
jgi:hypothetical protein